MENDETPDVQAIRALIDRQFKSLSWTVGERPDLGAFKADFVPGAPLYASARPVRPQSVDQFAERMDGLVGTTLNSFDETVLGGMVRIHGNVAVAVVACANVENASETNRNVEMMLLVKDEGVWRIAAQAWDKESDSNPVTDQFGTTASWTGASS